jgi:CheY-like chemotaxis protein
MNARASILIVDDEKTVRGSLTKWFLEDGFQVGAAENAGEALRQVQAQHWDVILLDIRIRWPPSSSSPRTPRWIQRFRH